MRSKTHPGGRPELPNPCRSGGLPRIDAANAVAEITCRDALELVKLGRGSEHEAAHQINFFSLQFLILTPCQGTPPPTWQKGNNKNTSSCMCCESAARSPTSTQRGDCGEWALRSSDLPTLQLGDVIPRRLAPFLRQLGWRVMCGDRSHVLSSGELVVEATGLEAPCLLPHCVVTWQPAETTLWTNGSMRWHWHVGRRGDSWDPVLRAILLALALCFGRAAREGLSLFLSLSLSFRFFSMFCFFSFLQYPLCLFFSFS